MTLALAEMTPAWAAVVASWRYPPPYDVYDGTVGDTAGLLDGNHVAILEHGALVGFAGVGQEARVRGGPAQEIGVTDVGIGLDPSRLSHGLGTEAGTLVLETLRLSGHRTLRASILGSNERSLRLARRLGFRDVGEFVDDEQHRFVVLVCAPEA